jgi:membrane associated rhomboid family serine protease
MRYSSRYRFAGYSSGSFPTGVKWLLIINIGLFVLYFLFARTELGQLFRLFYLTPAAVVGHFAVWQLFTYMFLHAGIGHVLFNMLALWMFGADLETTWGTKRFLTYYFICGVGAGICDVVVSAMFGSYGTSTIGSSGAIYGLLLAFGLMYPDRTVLMSFLFPIKAKYFVMIMGAIAFLSSLGSSGSGVSHVAHLGGMLFGYLYLRGGRAFQFDFGRVHREYEAWKLRRARRKFQVYMKKHSSRRGPWVQ